MKVQRGRSPPILQVTDAAIRAAVSPSAYAAGQAYFRNGRVSRIAIRPEGGVIESAVRGSAGAPYDQTILLHEKRGMVRVEGECTCPVGFNCKHVAAALIAQSRAIAALPFAPAASAGNQATGTAAHASSQEAVPPDLLAWLTDLPTIAAADSEAFPPTVSKRVFFFLSAHRRHSTAPGELNVKVAVVHQRHDGTINQRHSTPSEEALLYSRDVQYLRPSDRTILRELSAYGLNTARSDVARLLKAILATGRARLGEFPGMPARLGETRPASLAWRLEPDATQRMVLETDPATGAVLLPEPWYLDEATGEVGVLQTAITPTLLRKLLDAPPVPPRHIDAVRDALVRTMPIGVPVPVPVPVPHGGDIGGKPTPLLRLRRLPHAYAASAEAPADGAALLSFRYGPVEIPARTATLRRMETERQEWLHDGTRYAVTRNHSAERRLAAEVTHWGLRPHGGDGGTTRAAHAIIAGAGAALPDLLVMPAADPGSSWLDFMLDGVPDLREQGWEVLEEPDFPYMLLAPTGPMQAELRQSSGIDWFDFDLGVMVGDERIDLVPSLLRLLNDPDAAALLEMLRDKDEEPTQRIVVPLPDGRRMALAMESVRPILITLFELFGVGAIQDKDGRLGVSRMAAADMATLEEAGLAASLVWRGGEALRALGGMLRRRGGIGSAPVPAWFAASLRPYQQQGVDWLQFLREAGLAGVLADDMGLGKTVQTLAHLCIEKQAGRLDRPALVICPTSVVGNWVKEAARFAPSLRVLPLQGTDRKTRFDDIASHDVVISTYPLLARDGEVLGAQEWHVLILDEAQMVKNPAAGMAQAVRRLRADQRICLTGTPMENHLGELWALFDFMMPGFLGSAKDFGRRFRVPIEKGGDRQQYAALARRIAPFLLRRTKAAVATELPPRTDILETIQIGTPQRAVYDAIRLAMHAKVKAAIAEKGLAKSGIVILDALLKMRQACCDPRLLKIGGAAAKKAGSAKLERLLELLTTALDEGRSILLFSQFTSMLVLIEQELEARRIDYVKLTGETVDRETPIGRFQAGKVKLFLISLKAGGVGLNLTAADMVIHYDPWWNPAVENQATDRAHRIGQTRSVFVHRLITEATIEEKMEALKAKKAALAAGILGGAGESALKMTAADVEMLFS